jgi:hypothetical protein
MHKTLSLEKQKEAERRAGTARINLQEWLNVTKQRKFYEGIRETADGFQPVSSLGISRHGVAATVYEML